MTESEKWDERPLEPGEGGGYISIGHYGSDESYFRHRRNLEAAVKQAQEIARKQRKRNVRPWHVPKSG